MSIFTFKAHVEPTTGMPGFRVLAGRAVLGTVFSPVAREWHGVTPRGVRVLATSREKAAEALALVDEKPSKGGRR